MRFILLTSIVFLLCSFSHAQTKEQALILNHFIEAHNSGTKVSIKHFIETTYHPDVYKKIDLDKHIAFYNQIVNEFGPLNFMIYKKVEESPSKLIVQLIKKEESIKNEAIDPAEILVVEIDMHEKDGSVMPRGLGLGALICERKKD